MPSIWYSSTELQPLPLKRAVQNKTNDSFILTVFQWSQFFNSFQMKSLNCFLSLEATLKSSLEVQWRSCWERNKKTLLHIYSRSQLHHTRLFPMGRGLLCKSYFEYRWKYLRCDIKIYIYISYKGIYISCKGRLAWLSINMWGLNIFLLKSWLNPPNWSNRNSETKEKGQQQSKSYMGLTPHNSMSAARVEQLKSVTRAPAMTSPMCFNRSTLVVIQSTEPSR